MMTGSPEQMQHIQDEGKLDDWCRDSLDWLRKEVGNENIVSAVLHMDEQTPHIHATVVPIVTGERRKARQEAQKTGKKYKKKNINAPRLCADDIMSKERFKHMQDTYAQAMSKFGLARGKEGSEARHISTQQYYRELATIETKIQQAKQEYEPYKAQEELNLIHNLFPMMKEQLRIADLCKTMGLAFNSIKALLEGRNLTAKTFSFFSPEHKQKFTAEDVKLKMEKEPDNPDKLRLNLNGQNIIDWFREQYQRVKQATNHYTRPTIKPEVGKSKGIKR
jgi:hypothetical protein